VELKHEGGASRFQRVMGAAIFTVICSFVLFWVIILFKGGFTKLNDEDSND
jgi:hypothetical protein